MKKEDLKQGLEGRGRGRRNYYDYEELSEFEVTVQPMTSVLYKIKLFGAIEDPRQFNGAIEAFERADPNDHVVIHLSTPGGSLDATDTFINAMRMCAAPVHIIASGGVHSAGTVILLNAPSFSLSENFNCLVHNGSCGPGGKFSDWKAAAQHTDGYMSRVLRKTYEGFLTDEEIEALLNGKDFWMDADEFCKRYEDRNEKFKAEDGDEDEDPGVEAMMALLEQAAKKPSPRKRKPKNNN